MICAMAATFSSISLFRRPWLLMFLTLALILHLSMASDSTSCNGSEREALLGLKASFFPPNETIEGVEDLDSWKGLNCCDWEGVECHNTTYHVVGLNLSSLRSNANLQSENFDANLLTPFEQLQYLVLSNNKLGGELPVEEISSLKHLYWLDLSKNSFEGKIPEEIDQLLSLRHLNLSNNQLQGRLPESLGNISSLQFLSLSTNQLQGTIPLSFANLSLLKDLDLEDNQLEGTIPPIFDKLRYLEHLNLSRNDFSGNFSFSMLANHPNLTIVNLSHNNKLVILQTNDTPAFQLVELDLSYSDMSKYDLSVPGFLSNQKTLSKLLLAYSNLSGSIPPWVLGASHNWLYLHGNMFTGQLVLPPTPTDLLKLDLSNNRLSGELPKEYHSFFPHLSEINVSGNVLTGNVASYLHAFQGLDMLDLSVNKISGNLPLELSLNLLFLDLTNNQVTGNLPASITYGNRLRALWLSNNHLTGPLLSENFNLLQLESLRLDGNSFSGTIPKNLFLRIPSLKVLNIRNNNFSGSIPVELEELSNLQVLILRENRFEDGLPVMCMVKRLTILDLSRNNLRESIPPCFQNISSWVQNSGPSLESLNSTRIGTETSYREVVSFTKGNNYDYFGLTLSLMTGIDLSQNQLQGHIPTELGLLKGLIVLNISNNHLTGSIPASFDQLRRIEVLDLSNNKLEGRIPPQLVLLYSLSTFSVANNNLSGVVPNGFQFSTFSESSYHGNPGLCGFMGKPCSTTLPPSEVNEDEKEDSIWEKDNLVLYAVIAMGFIVGFWGVLAFFFLNMKWTTLCFETMDRSISSLSLRGKSRGYSSFSSSGVTSYSVLGK
ncbi:hypothetical protein AMTRI_Chr04g180440 [Amborella trichopoda]